MIESDEYMKSDGILSKEFEKEIKKINNLRGNDWRNAVSKLDEAMKISRINKLKEYFNKDEFPTPHIQAELKPTKMYILKSKQDGDILNELLMMQPETDQKSRLWMLFEPHMIGMEMKLKWKEPKI